jgi:hypothetical protein
MIEQPQITQMAPAVLENVPLGKVSPQETTRSHEASNSQVWTHLGAITFLYAAALVLALRPQWAMGLSLQCVMLTIFHIKCPFCGMTRDFVAILHGHLSTLNPFSWATLAALYLGYPCVFLLTWRKQRLDIFYQPLVYKVGCAGLVLMCLVNNFCGK